MRANVSSLRTAAVTTFMCVLRAQPPMAQAHQPPGIVKVGSEYPNAAARAFHNHAAGSFFKADLVRRLALSRFLYFLHVVPLRNRLLRV
jgi:hypothetical protein